MLNIIYVDDEYMALENFAGMFKRLVPKQKLQLFQDCSEALAYAQEKRVDVAFLDINMMIDGMTMADKLRRLNSDIRLVFVTAYNNYAAEAFARDALGYLLKPFEDAALEKVLVKVGVLRDDSRKKKIYFQTIPHFAMYLDDEPHIISGNRVREVLAYLLDAEGKAVSNRELLENVWEEDAVDGEKLLNVRVTLSHLRQKLKELGISDLLISQYGQVCLDVRRYTWDVEEIKQGNKETIARYDGRYLEEYSWSEYNNARIAELVGWDWD